MKTIIQLCICPCPYIQSDLPACGSVSDYNMEFIIAWEVCDQILQYIDLFYQQRLDLLIWLYLVWLKQRCYPDIMSILRCQFFRVNCQLTKILSNTLHGMQYLQRMISMEVTSSPLYVPTHKLKALSLSFWSQVCHACWVWSCNSLIFKQ